MWDRVEVDWLFVDQQLKNSGLSHSEDVLVRKVLHILEQAELTQDEVDTFKGVLETVEALFRGHALPTANADEQWVDAVPGDIANRDRVRVKPDAYTGRLGTLHNGKVGRVATLRNGKAAVVYDGASIEVPPQHEIRVLQKLV